MSTPKTIALARGERVIAVVPEMCVGPGWANAPTWVYIERDDHTLRIECIQPDERSERLHALAPRRIRDGGRTDRLRADSEGVGRHTNEEVK